VGQAVDFGSKAHQNRYDCPADTNGVEGIVTKGDEGGVFRYFRFYERLAQTLPVLLTQSTPPTEGNYTATIDNKFFQKRTGLKKCKFFHFSPPKSHF